MTNPAERGGEPELAARLVELEARVEGMSAILSNLALGKLFGEVPMHVFPGGEAPRPATDGAIGYDCYARSIVRRDGTKDSNQPMLRASRADFIRIHEPEIDPVMQPWMNDDPLNRPDYYSIALPPNGRCLVSLGFATAMPMPLFYFVLPRSGFASKGINLDNSPGTVDPDYRGEAGALITNRSDEPFEIYHGQRIVQAVFSIAIMPQFNLVEDYEELQQTARGIGGFGSTGSHG